jgi:predicted TIM-barrel fold metal-dependent hydrolase
MTTRRSFAAQMAAGLAVSAGLPARGEDSAYTIDTHIHLFDPARFPYHSNGTYSAPPATLETFLSYAKQVGLAHAVIVHPEPYQDDHRYLEYAFTHEGTPGFFKGTCLFDPIDPRTPARIRDITARNKGRIVALRIHAMNAPGKPPKASGPIKDRDLADPAMKAAWKQCADLGLAVQMHFLPHHAPAIGKLAVGFSGVPVILDHLGRFGLGSQEAADQVIALGRHKNVIMKFSSPRHSSKQPHPHADVKPFVKRCYESFGPDRIIRGSLGNTVADLRRNEELLAFHFDFASAADRAKIRGLNAKRIFSFSE